MTKKGRGIMRSDSILHEKKYPFCHLFVSLTQKCNLRCKHCYLGTERLNNPISFTYDEMRRIMAYFSSLGTTRITFLGGEPTLHKDFVKILNEAYDSGFDVLVDTNGIFPKKLLKEIRNDRITYFNFSLDGSVADLHEKIRGENTFNMCLENIKYAVERGFNVGIVDTLSTINLEDVPKMIKLAEELGVTLLNFHKLTRTGCAWEMIDNIIPPEKWIKFVDWLEMERFKKPKLPIILYPPFYSRIDSFKRYLNKGYKGCIARQFERISIYPDGSAFLCTLMLDRPFNFAKFHDGDLSMNRKFNELDLIFSMSECSECNLFNQCKGGCSVDRSLYEEECHYKLGKNIISLCALWKIVL